MAAVTSSITIYSPNYKCVVKASKLPSSLKPTSRTSKLSTEPEKTIPLAKNLAIASTILSPLASSPLALAAKQIAESPQEDNRGLVLLVPVAAAVGWVLFNILGPALNQLNRMRSEKMTIVGLGLGGLITATSAWLVPAASAASEVIENEGVSEGGNQGLLPLVVAGAVALEVLLLNSMQPKSEEKGANH
ncbi:photosystem II core complex proteins psbY, chloroplastic-like [Amaranthus tricolor]|uniref:photosystem II core complex proteins psbY, chloroplastic-like n=1 Tax=Amaranthus tricolor TaxID=29722 RepID=UPI00258E0310|nr:photosystem II core complex proteins psbY, chloroplastic-like [Amaranthus tricolor]